MEDFLEESIVQYLEEIPGGLSGVIPEEILGWIPGVTSGGISEEIPGGSSEGILDENFSGISSKNNLKTVQAIFPSI